METPDREALALWVDRPECFKVYYDAYFLRFSEAFEADFPRTKEAVDRARGPGAFRGLVMEFLQAHPLRTPNLNGAGAGFADHLRTDALGLAHPFLTDLARLEWAVVECFLAVDGEFVPPSSPSEFSRLAVLPCVRLVETSYPVLPLWKDGLGAEAGKVCVFRARDGSIEAVATNSVEWALLKGAGRSLGEVCAAFNEAQSAEVQQGISRLFGLGCLGLEQA